MKICPSCGTENRKKARFCYNCGVSLKKDTGNISHPSPSACELRRGAILKKRFEILTLLNIGGMGYIYQGYDRGTKKVVAIKEMIDRFYNPRDRSDAIERFRREASILCKLEHKAIPKFLDYFVENQRYYLVMELIKGLDLRKVLQRMEESDRQLPYERVIDWAIEICSVLEYLHSYSPPIVYRDLKPSNIIITPGGEIKLVDFGIARLFIPRIKATMVGTQGYAPPEQYRGKAEPRSDIFALGATMHHLLSGKNPQTEAPFHFEPLNKLNPEIPATLVEVVHKALQLVPDDRYQSASEFKNALLRLKFASGRSGDLSEQIQSIKEEISQLKRKKSNILQRQYRLNVSPIRRKKTSGRRIEKQINQGWYQYRGNKFRNGSSIISSNLRGRLRWSFETGVKILSSPVVDADKHVYVGTGDGEFYCLDERGKVKWIFPAGKTISSTAALDNRNRAYLATEGNKVIALNRNGLQRWSFKTLGSVTAAPLIVDKRLYVLTNNGILYCLTLSGKQVWYYDLETTTTSSPTAGVDGKIFVTCYTGEIFAITPSGKLAWKGSLPGIISSTPAVGKQGIMLVSCEDSYLYALDLQGKLIWKFKTGKWIKSSPALKGRQGIYVCSGDRHLYSINVRGQENWRFDCEDNILSSPSVSDEGTIYFSTENGILYALYPHGKSKWWFNLGGRVISSPAIGPEGNLYITTVDGFVYSIS